MIVYLGSLCEFAFQSDIQTGFICSCSILSHVWERFGAEGKAITVVTGHGIISASRNCYGLKSKILTALLLHCMISPVKKQESDCNSFLHCISLPSVCCNCIILKCYHSLITAWSRTKGRGCNWRRALKRYFPGGVAVHVQKYTL